MNIKYCIFRFLLPWSFLISASVAVAATEEKTHSHPLPTELRYTSALAHYKAYTDQAVLSWREANDRVGQVGGWRAHAKEMAEQPASNAQPAINPHAGHEGRAKK